MTKSMTCATIKGKNVSGGDIPKQGTKLREVYDALRRGEHVINQYAEINQLQNFYGMVTESTGRRGHYLLGEWEGTYYVPLERILQPDP